MFHRYLKQGFNCVKKVPNYVAQAIFITFSFNFKEFLSEDLLVESVSSCFNFVKI